MYSFRKCDLHLIPPTVIVRTVKKYKKTLSTTLCIFPRDPRFKLLHIKRDFTSFTAASRLTSYGRKKNHKV